MRSVLPAVAEQLLRDIEKTYQETSQSKKVVHEEMNIIILLLLLLYIISSRSVAATSDIIPLISWTWVIFTNKSVFSECVFYSNPVLMCI